MLRVIPVRAQISHRMQGSVAMPAEGIVGDSRGGGWDTYLPGSIPVQPDWNHSTPRADHGTNHRIQESSFGVCSWSIPTLIDVKRDEAVSTHLNSANILTHVNLSMTSACPSLNMAMEGVPRTRAVGKYVRRDKRSARRKVWTW